MPHRKSPLLVLLSLTLTAGLLAQNRPDAPEFVVKEHYTKYEYRIPMRDGARLFTSVYVPKDTSHSYPFLIDRTPYSVAPYGVDLYRTNLGPSPRIRQGRIHFRVSGRTRPLHVGRHVHRNAPAH